MKKGNLYRLSTREFLDSLTEAKMCQNCIWFKGDILSGKLYCHVPMLEGKKIQIPSGTCVCGFHNCKFGNDI